jgi:hypothetical protein
MIKQIHISCILLSLLVWSNVLVAQTNKELEFNVVKPKSDVKIEPSYQYLIYEAPHKISVVSKDKNTVLKLKLAGGSVLIRNTDTVLVAENLNGNGVMLKVYDVSNGQEKLLATKNYDVIPRPELYIENKLIGIQEFNTLDSNFFSNTLELKAKYKNTYISFELLSFSFGMTCKGTYHEWRVKGNKLHKEALGKLYECCRPNVKIYFERMEFKLGTGETQMANVSSVKFK